MQTKFQLAASWQFNLIYYLCAKTLIAKLFHPKKLCYGNLG